MSDTLALFLPAALDAPWRWLLARDGVVVASGDGLPSPDQPVETRIVAIAPADAVTLHWATLPDRSLAQATAAARIVVNDVSAAPQDGLHVAVGEADGEDRPIGVVAAERMREWLDALLAIGIDPAALVPAPLLLPRIEQGFLRADLGSQMVVRGQATGFADESGLTELVTGGVVPTLLRGEALEHALARAAATPSLNLRQGAFARRRRQAIDWAMVRRVAMLIGLFLLVTLAINLVTITRYSLAASRLEAQADAIARQALPRGAAEGGDAARALDERLSRLRGPGQGFTRTTSAVVSAVRATQGVEIAALDFQPNGDLLVTVTADGDAQTNALQARLRDAGFGVSGGAFESTGGRLKGQITVSAR